ncbi:DegV family protein [Williamsoniiplasma lucivorax]|uniref:Fatty acid-binding protein DegV n=1 Tax=Williamsoniiplasma lucivorax TaxID=209274 RepID=A0A2S5RFQ6_9MOLU|nr:DegV family protein [Williamsoniiplasma lucivorax]PPE06131.1 fatty acid-binding protein DegV [Williamsoniiplasma lucivorax]
MKIGFLIDSSAIINTDDFTKTHIEVIPLHITSSDGIDILDTPENVKKINFWELIKNGKDFKTSQASPGELEVKYNEMLTKYDHVIHIPIPGNLSSMLSTAMMVAKSDEFKNKVTVIDNKTIPAQGIREMALYLDGLVKQEKLTTPADIVKEYNAQCHSMYIAIVPSNLKKLASGGRAKTVISTVLNILKTKVLIRWNEKPEKQAIGRTMHSIMHKVIETVKTEFNGGNARVYFLCSQLVSQKYIDAVKEAFEEAKIKYITEPISALYPVHAGIETIGFLVTDLKY